VNRGQRRERRLGRLLSLPGRFIYRGRRGPKLVGQPVAPDTIEELHHTAAGIAWLAALEAYRSLPYRRSTPARIYL
jgi:hypothetical protein